MCANARSYAGYATSVDVGKLSVLSVVRVQTCLPSRQNKTQSETARITALSRIHFHLTSLNSHLPLALIRTCFLVFLFPPCSSVRLFYPPSPDQHTCSADRFKCKNNRCIPLRWLCDGDNDCGNDEDESNTTCSGAQTHSYTEIFVLFCCCSSFVTWALLLCLSARTCPPNQYSCASGRCIPISWTCDLDDDCGDRSDEPASCG